MSVNNKSFEERSIDIIRSEKEKKFLVEKYSSGENDGVFITPLTLDAVNDDLIADLARWRSENQDGFIKIFNVTFESTRKWLELAVQNRSDRLLFLVYDCHEKLIGHLGVSSFDFTNKTCEVDNVVRGNVSKQKRVMSSASKALIDWIWLKIKPESIRLKVLNDNSKALALYYKLGFKLDLLEPLEKIESGDVIEWIPAENSKIDRFFINMFLRGMQ